MKEGDVLAKVAAALQEALHDPHANIAQGSVVTKWAVVVEAMDGDGAKHLIRFDGDAGGARLHSWEREGLLHAALDPFWSDELPPEPE